MKDKCQALLKSLSIFISASLLAACGGGGVSPMEAINGTSNVYKDALTDFMTRTSMQSAAQYPGLYYWSDETTVLDSDNYSDVYELLDGYTAQIPQDRFSFITTVEADEDRQQGLGGGLGFLFRYLNDDEAEITYVYPDSAADMAGLVRGDIINRDSTNYVYDDNGNYTGFSGTKNDNEAFSYSFNEFTIDPVYGSKVFDHNGTTVGYLYFTSFIQAAESLLNEQFINFANSNIDELVIDVRYNGGGLVSIATQLASLVTDDADAGSVFTELRFNDRYAAANESYNLEALGDDLGLSRVFILTTQDSASASEMMINGLTPFMDVIVVGETTYGKPVGMSPMEIDDLLYVFISFEGVNANGEGGYFDGIAPTSGCNITDDAAFQLGSMDEPLLAGALNYIDTGSCSAVSQLNGRSLAPATFKKNQPLENMLHYMY